MPNHEKRITVRVPEKLHRRVKIKAAQLGVTISDVLREYLEHWAEDDPPGEEKRKEQ